MAEKPWTTSYPTTQDPGPNGADNMPALDDETTPGAGDGDTILSSHVEALRDKVHAVALEVGDDSDLPANSLRDRVSSLETGGVPLPLSSAGDILVHDSASGNVALPVGTTGQILAANTTLTTGLEWSSLPAASTWVEKEFIPTAGQITFILDSAPSDSESLTFSVNGIVADDVTDYVVSGVTITWLNTPFSLDTDDKVVVKYK